MSIESIYKRLSSGDTLLYAWFQSMHTRVDVVLCNETEDVLTGISRLIREELSRLEKLASFFDTSSELCRINRLAGQQPEVINAELYAMIRLCMEYNVKTEGCFDICVKSDNYNSNTIQSVHLSDKDTSIFFDRGGLRLDLSGFLKGYALEKVREIIHSHHLENALINIGNSSIMALGNHPYGEGWKVAASHSFEADSKQVTLHNECYTTSGNDTKCCHIIHPQSGSLVEGKGAVSVVTENGAVGEILSTALFAASPMQRKQIVQNFREVIVI